MANRRSGDQAASIGGSVLISPRELKMPATTQYAIATPMAVAIPARPPRLPMDTANGTAMMAMTRVIAGIAILLASCTWSLMVSKPDWRRSAMYLVNSV